MVEFLITIQKLYYLEDIHKKKKRKEKDARL